MTMALSEKQVEKHIRKYLVGRGWRTTNLPRTVGSHGADITAWHPTWRRILILETKGDSKSHPHQAAHNGFWSVLGQILTRMDKEGNHPKKGRIYAIGIPKRFETVFRKKIGKMEYGWRLLRLRVFLVDARGNVEDRPHSHFLR